MSPLKKVKKYYNLAFRRKSGDHPRILILFVTSVCNMRCEHCFYSNNLNKPNDLNLAEILDISRDLGQIANLLLSGGEPFTRKDLPEILEFFYQNNSTRSYQIPTNGILIEQIIPCLEKIRKKCKDAKVKVNISIDGMERTHNEIRQFPNAFAQSIENSEKIFNHFKNENLFEFAIVSTIMDKNIQEMNDLADYIDVRFKGTVPILFGLIRGEPKGKHQKLTNIAELLKVHKHSIKRRKNVKFLDKLIYNAAFELKLNIMEKQCQILPCVAGELIGVIYPDGQVSSCELLPTVGSVRDFDSFSQLWDSGKLLKQRESIRRKECYCTHECFITPSFIYSKLGWFLLPYYYIKNKARMLKVSD